MGKIKKEMAEYRLDDIKVSGVCIGVVGDRDKWRSRTKAARS